MDLTGFLFGNVNKQGQLENEEVLDRVRLCVVFNNTMEDWLVI